MRDALAAAKIPYSQTPIGMRENLQFSLYRAIINEDVTCKSAIAEVQAFDEWIKTAQVGDSYRSSLVDSKNATSGDKYILGIIPDPADPFGFKAEAPVDIKDYNTEYMHSPADVMADIEHFFDVNIAAGRNTVEDKLAVLETFIDWFRTAHDGDVFEHEGFRFQLDEGINVECPYCDENIASLELCDNDKVWTDDGDHLYVEICPHCGGMIWKDAFGKYRMMSELYSEDDEDESYEDDYDDDYDDGFDE